MKREVGGLSGQPAAVTTSFETLSFLASQIAHSSLAGFRCCFSQEGPSVSSVGGDCLPLRRSSSWTSNLCGSFPE